MCELFVVSAEGWCCPKDFRWFFAHYFLPSVQRADSQFSTLPTRARGSTVGPLVRSLEDRGKVYFAEFSEGVFCEIFVAKRSANYTLKFFRIPQNSNKVESST